MFELDSAWEAIDEKGKRINESVNTFVTTLMF